MKKEKMTEIVVATLKLKELLNDNEDEINSLDCSEITCVIDEKLEQLLLCLRLINEEMFDEIMKKLC